MPDVWFDMNLSPFDILSLLLTKRQIDGALWRDRRKEVILLTFILRQFDKSVIDWTPSYRHTYI